MKNFIEQNFSVVYCYKVFFDKDIFNFNNSVFVNIFKNIDEFELKKVIFFIDDGVVNSNLDIVEKIVNYCNYYNRYILLKTMPIILKGGEFIKNDFKFNNYIYEIINFNNICRHSFVVAVGGGSLLDSVGFSVATAHRGIRLIRIPTTVLSQNDSGVGVKNGINYFFKKNFIGTFAPPYCVINDSDFLLTLSNRDWFSGISEAIKVSLIKDSEFFYFIRNNVDKLLKRDIDTMCKIVHRCAELHINHIGKGDPFEFGSSRPLDFGHWAAHKLESLTNGRLIHGEAVAIGICLDSTYSYVVGLLDEKSLKIIVQIFLDLKFLIFIDELNDDEKINSLIFGIQEFQEHLGGKLNVMMLSDIGIGVNVNNIDCELFFKTISVLKSLCL